MASRTNSSSIGKPPRGAHNRGASVALNPALSQIAATHLALGFDSRSGFSPGTAKTSVEGLAQGGKVRRDGRIISVQLAYKTRRIDFGDGEKLAMTIPWGDISTADRKSTRLNSSHRSLSRMPSSA